MKPFVWSSPPTNQWPRSLEISASTTRRSGTGSGSDKYRQERDAAPGAISESERHELTRLRKENAELKTEREILRKASAYFARETMR